MSIYKLLTVTLFCLIVVNSQGCSQIPQCLQCLTPTICDQCNEGYVQIQGKCQIKLNNQETQKLHIPDSDPTLPDLSQQPTKFGVSDSLRFSGVGVDPSATCVFVDPSTKYCLLCQKGYDLRDGSCIEKITKCIEFDQNNKCQKCRENYFLHSSGNCFDLNCFQNGYYDCEKCFDGFVKHPNGYCYDINCKKYQQGVCRECKDLYRIKTGEKLCIKMTDIQISALPRPNNTTNDNNKNATNETTKTNSTTNNTQGGSGGTIIIVKNVTKNESSTNKTTVVTNITTTTTITTTIIFGCVLFDIEGACNRCKDSFVLKNGICENVDPFCRRYDPLTYICYQCLPDYSLIRGFCVSNNPHSNCAQIRNNDCIRCIDRFYVFNGICLNVDRTCKDYNHTSGVCLTCEDNYQLLQGKCLLLFSRPNDISNKTNIKIYNESKISEFSRYYCLEYKTNTDYCEKCFSRFYAFQGLCWRVNPHCKGYYQNNGSCSSCYKGYRLQDDKCLIDLTTNPTDNCKKYNPTNERCEDCYDRFFPFQGVCIQVYQYCKEYALTNGRCTTCFNGYFLLDGFCEIVATALAVPYCQNYNPLDPRQCLKCVSGFYLSKNKCNKVSITCGAYDETTGNCLTCISSKYILIQFQCIIPLDNCKRIVNIKCEECNSGYVLAEHQCIKE